MQEVEKGIDNQFKKYFSDAYFGLCRECSHIGVCSEAHCDFFYRPFGYIEAYKLKSTEKEKVEHSCYSINV